MPQLRYLSNVVTLELDESKCNGCRRCVEVCPHAVLMMVNKRSRIDDLDACMECGACAKNCAEGALTVGAGVGCASAIIYGAIKGTEPSCDGTTGSSCC